MEKHNLKIYLEELEKEHLLLVADIKDPYEEKIVDKVSYNSKESFQNTLFVCKGSSFKEEYLDMAVSNGALAYVSEKDYNKKIPCILVSNVQNALSIVSIIYFNRPDRKINFIGITGTKGKSTTAYYIKYIIDEYLKAEKQGETGIISSIETFDGLTRKESHITTPESLDLQNYLNNAVEAGLEYLVAEVSSQALKYGRVYGLNIGVGVFLNISEDHISPIEHKDFEDYFSSKLKLFGLSKVACVNLESDHIDRIMEAAKKAGEIITFGFSEKADVYGYNIRKDGFDTLFTVRTKDFDRDFKLTMPGLFNIENALAAIAVATVYKIPREYIFSGLEKAKASGRMEIYNSDDLKKLVIVDYAHNKLSFEKLYETAKNEYPDRSIITVFGCPGKKAFTRRRDLGLLAGINSKLIFLTAEDPGVEDVGVICEDIAQYVKINNKNCEIVLDREEAIKKAINSEVGKSVILLTGKGNETTQKIGKEYIPYPTDVECAIKYLNEYNGVR